MSTEISKYKMPQTKKWYIGNFCFRIVSGTTMLLIFAVNAFATDSASPTSRLARVKDISSVEGIRDNQLVGYGIVVGLQGTGDSQQTTFPIQTLAATLLRMGVSVPASSIRVQNLAAVFVSATLPPFSRSGTKLDITVWLTFDDPTLWS
jgi:flagellar P-ring protein precursor FlgI